MMKIFYAASTEKHFECRCVDTTGDFLLSSHGALEAALTACRMQAELAGGSVRYMTMPAKFQNAAKEPRYRFCYVIEDEKNV